MSLRIGALFAGYGGLDMAVMGTLDAELAWYAEWDKAPAKVMAHHHPGVPNLWDVTKVDWAAVEPVDIITGGSPCQDLSHAGKRKGMTDGTRSNLWAEMREAIAVHRPRLVVWENVRGAFSAVADSDLEPCPRCVGGADVGGTVLRALGRVLGDLSELGYDARWYGLRAADVGGAHGRFRVFVCAAPANTDGRGRVQALEHDGSDASGVDGAGVPDESDRDALRAGPLGGLSLLPTPMAYVRAEGTYWMPESDEQLHMAPNEGGTPWLESAVVWVESHQDWRQYAPAIRRAEIATGRTAPAPTEIGAKGRPRLSPAFVEWLMMLPAGHVTAPDIGLTRNEQLKALGNGVVPAQAAAALRAYIQDERQDVA